MEKFERGGQILYKCVKNPSTNDVLYPSVCLSICVEGGRLVTFFVASAVRRNSVFLFLKKQRKKNKTKQKKLK